MFTQQSQMLLAALAGAFDPQQSMALVNVLANCAQPLVHRGSVTIDNGSRSPAPSGGYAYTADDGSDLLSGTSGWNPGTLSPVLVFTDGGEGSGYGGGGGGYGGGGGGGGGYGGGGYGGFGHDGTFGNNFYVGGGDVFGFPPPGPWDGGAGGGQYGNTSGSQQNFNNITNAFSDNSYNDFSTALNVTNNAFNQSTTNLGGDTNIDSSVITNLTTQNVVNEGAVVNNSNVVNNSSVVNMGSTYLGGPVFINPTRNGGGADGGGVTNINRFITNVIMENGGFKLDGKLRVPKYKINPSTCDLERDGDNFDDIDISGLSAVPDKSKGGWGAGPPNNGIFGGGFGDAPANEAAAGGWGVGSTPAVGGIA